VAADILLYILTAMTVELGGYGGVAVVTACSVTIVIANRLRYVYDMYIGNINNVKRTGDWIINSDRTVRRKKWPRRMIYYCGNEEA
jgi:hypothetical protein